MSVNEKILNKEVAHSIDILGYGNSVSKKIINILNKADVDLVAQLNKAIEAMPANKFNVERLDNLLKSVRKINTDSYKSVDKELNSELKQFTGYETDYQQSTLTAVQPAPVVAVIANDVYAAAMAKPFEGKLLKEFISGLEQQKATLIRDAVRMGFIESQTTSQIVTRIRGTKELKYADGILSITRRNAETVVRTAIAHTANFAQETIYQANSDIIKGFRYTATLDTRTTELCASRDGNFYKLGDKKPALPAHFNCRSRYVPVLKSFKELGLDAEEFPESTRASMDGQVPDKLNYQEWLKKQSIERQNKVLGVEKAKLFRDGKLTLDRFVSPSGHVYTLDQLKQQNDLLVKETKKESTSVAKEQPKTWDKNTKQARLHDVSFNNAPQYMKDAIVKHDGKLKDVIIRKSGEYSTVTKTISNPEPDSVRNRGTWRHEYGHFLDNVLAVSGRYRSSGKDFDAILKSETEVVLKNAGFGRRSAAQAAFNVTRQGQILDLKNNMIEATPKERQALIVSKAKDINFNLDNFNKFFANETTYLADDLDTIYRKALMLDAIANKDVASFMVSLNSDWQTTSTIYKMSNVGKFSDLVGSATKNKLLGQGTHGNGGHSNSYYRQVADRANTEVFANLTALLGAENQFWTDVVDVFYPETAKLYRAILNE